MSQPDGGAPKLVSRAETAPLPAYVADLWRRREFAWALALGNLRAEHLDTVLGNLWHVLNPAMLILVYWFIFGEILGTSRGVDNFIGFLGVGVFTYQFSQRTITACGSSISNNIGLIRSLQFPRAVLPVATVVRETIAYTFSFGVLLLAMLLTGEPLSPEWFLGPVLVLLLAVFSAGVGLAVARLADRVRDVSNVLPFLFRLLFYGSAIIFSLRAFVDDPALRRWFVLNPFFTFIELLRDVLMDSYQAEHPDLAWAFALVVAPVTFVLGLAYFRGGEKTYGRG